ncbi:MAG TPA: zinc-dependent dehydrogenase [Ktedonobacterales bacterium]|jgi:L-iditol 2-dehydrogenase
MRAVEYHANDDVRVVDLPVPEIGPGEMLLQMQACGICASDVMEWYMKPRAPLYPGHEPVGTISALGEGVRQFAIGQRVFVHHHVPCMVCHFCQRGAFSQCATFRATRLHPGGLAEYIRVPALNVERDVLALPDDLSFESATLIEPLACCLRGIERAGIRPGDTVCVLGAGSNGLMLAQLAQQRGATRVIITDPIAYRRAHALEIGVDVVLDSSADLLDQLLAANQGRKPDVVIVTPSHIAAMQQALTLVGPGGTVLLFAPPPPTEIFPVPANALFFQEITLRTSYSAGPHETRLALETLHAGRIRAESVITHRFSLNGAPQAFKLVAHPGEALKVVISP